jgi:ABC-type multidrug transport system permease subunit
MISVKHGVREAPMSLANGKAECRRGKDEEKWSKASRNLLIMIGGFFVFIFAFFSCCFFGGFFFREARSVPERESKPLYANWL